MLAVDKKTKIPKFVLFLAYQLCLVKTLILTITFEPIEIESLYFAYILK